MPFGAKWDLMLVFDCSDNKRAIRFQSGSAKDRILLAVQTKLLCYSFEDLGQTECDSSMSKNCIDAMDFKMRSEIKNVLISNSFGQTCRCWKRELSADVLSGSCEGHMFPSTGIVSCVIDSDSLRE